jgi:dihydroxyacetone kinase DhaKLM complex PTS-EIIA-like component DhaM
VERPVIGIVVVSHSPRLADAAVELARQMVQGDGPPMVVVAGVDGRFGTDAAAVAQAIDALADTGGVLVVPDLGSAVLSAEMALDLRRSSVEVVVGAGPFVESLAVGIPLAALGCPLDTVATAVATALSTTRRARSFRAAPDAVIPMP